MIPKKARKLTHKTLREGEHTGHAHVALADDVELFLDGERLYMRTPNGTEIVHEEHGPQSIPPGDKRVGAVREMDHFENAAREVAD